MDAPDSFGTTMISSLELIEKTRISRATLNNYIKLGILPRPIVKAPNDKRIRAKQIGFYPRTVLDRMKSVKMMKQEGLSMNHIVNKLQAEASEDYIQNVQLTVKKSTNRTMNDEEGSQAALFPLETDKEGATRIDDAVYESSSNDILKNINEQIQKRNRALRYLLNLNEPIQVAFSVLSAKLQDANRLRSELPREEYFDLMNQIINMAEETLKECFGIYGRTYGIEIIYYCIKNMNSNYLMDSVYSAIRLKDRMKIISNDWRRKKDWSNDLFLNIGIADGYDHIDIIPSLHSIEFKACGDSVNHAEKLSSFASNGSIWITKNLINKLNASERKRILFGIKIKDNIDQKYIENTFTRIMDTFGGNNPYNPDYMDVSTIPITEIMGIS